MVLSCSLPHCAYSVSLECARIPAFKYRVSSATISPTSVLLLQGGSRFGKSTLGGSLFRKSTLGGSLFRKSTLGGSLASDLRASCVRMSSAAAESLASKDGEGGNAIKSVNVIIKGSVQGVYYRNWTVDNAKQLSVNGWVRNLKDGSVEAVFCGKSPAVNSLIDKCHTGPPAAKVSGVEVSAWKDEVPQGFERKPTIW